MDTFFSIKGRGWHLFLSLFLSTSFSWREMEYLKTSLEKVTIHPAPQKRPPSTKEPTSHMQDEITLQQSSIKRPAGQKVLRVRGR